MDAETSPAGNTPLMGDETSLQMWRGIRMLTRHNTVGATSLPVIGYGPDLGLHLIREIQHEGHLVTRDLQLLIDVDAP